MPIHDWKRADAGLFHHFRQQWSGELCNGLNAGVLSAGLFALIEQKALGVEPDLMTLSRRPRAPQAPKGGIAIAEVPPKVRHTHKPSEAGSYAARANRVGIRTKLGELVAVVEIVSPGNKDRDHSIRALIDKTLDFLANGVHVLVIDLFPPTPDAPRPACVVELCSTEPRWHPPGDLGRRGRRRVHPAARTAVDTRLLRRCPGVHRVRRGGRHRRAAPRDAPLPRVLHLRPRTAGGDQRTWEKCPDEIKEIIEGRSPADDSV